MTTTAALIKGVSKQFGANLAVDNLSISVPEGSIYGLIGPNGAGKTTTLRMLMGIWPPDSGLVTVLDGQNPKSVKNRLGYLPEEKGLYRKMSVLDLAVFFGTLKGLSRSAATRAAQQRLTEFGLADRGSEKCEVLSKGMAQKLQIICTLLHEPQLIVLDEPFSGLDPVNVEMIRGEILKLKKSGVTLVISTHIMEQAEQICDEICLLNKGKAILQGNLQDIRQHTDRRITINYTSDHPFPTTIDGIERINIYGNRAELTLNADAKSEDVLAKLLHQVKITRFDTNQTSLHEIFVAKVNQDHDV